MDESEAVCERYARGINGAISALTINRRTPGTESVIQERIMRIPQCSGGDGEPDGESAMNERSTVRVVPSPMRGRFRSNGAPRLHPGGGRAEPVREKG